MAAIKRIMVAVDLSQHSEMVMDYAKDIFNSTKAQLYVVNVINQRDVEAVSRVAQYAPNISVERYVEEQKEYRTQLIKDMLSKVQLNPENTKIIIKVGTPFSELLQVINQEEIDLVIMGATGRSNIATILLGSTADKMVRRSPVPVLIVRNTKIKKEEG